jgi:hypothetical protein
MMNDSRALLIAVVGATVSVLVLLMLALVPGMSGESYEFVFPGIVAAYLAIAGFTGWIVYLRATPARSWLIPIGLAAIWGIAGGGIATLSNYLGYSFWSSQLTSAQERVAASINMSKDSKGESLPENYIQQQREDARQDEEQTLEQIARAKTGCFLGISMLLVGGAAAARLAKLVRRGRSAT